MRQEHVDFILRYIGYDCMTTQGDIVEEFCEEFDLKAGVRNGKTVNGVLTNTVRGMERVGLIERNGMLPDGKTIVYQRVIEI